MAQEVKAVAAQATISSKHQVTIGKAAFEEAGFKPGDKVMVRALGPGQVVLTRLDELIAKYSGCVDGGGEIREAVEQLRDEWD